MEKKRERLLETMQKKFLGGGERDREFVPYGVGECPVGARGAREDE